MTTPKQPPPSCTRVVGYVRVSTDEQAEAGVSLDAQRARLEAYAGLYGLELVQVVTDAGVSAKSLERPGLARALAMIDAGEVGGILVAKLDRLTRSVRDLGELVDRYFASGHAALLSVGEQIDTRSAGGRLVLNVLASVAQWEREAIGERTSQAMRHKAARGEFIGGTAPYGWAPDNDGRLQRVEGEQATIARARALEAEGRSLRGIAAHLAAEGRLSRRAKPFHPEQVRAMLKGQVTTNAAA